MDTISIRQKVVDANKHISCALGLTLADCVTASLKIYMKLYKAGAVRVRGQRLFDRDCDAKYGGKPHYHYWVENKGMVFEEHGGVQCICDKIGFYRMRQIENVEYAPYVCFFQEELPENKELWYMFNDMSENQIKYLIEVYIRKSEK